MCGAGKLVWDQVAQLRAQLKVRRLKQTGSKAELHERLYKQALDRAESSPNVKLVVPDTDGAPQPEVDRAESSPNVNLVDQVQKVPDTDNAPQPTRWKCLWCSGMDIRSHPQVQRSGVIGLLKYGQIFDVLEERPGREGTLFLKLWDGPGWVFNQSRCGTFCIKVVDEVSTDVWKDWQGPSLAEKYEGQEPGTPARASEARTRTTKIGLRLLGQSTSTKKLRGVTRALGQAGGVPARDGAREPGATSTGGDSQEARYPSW